ncbi:MAG TPA: ABC transporter substrate-binding protein [Xanthobacteraceae bacterium]|nr:ABC transporter substrate-binding protein [Xanthobacteraceae bacterium]
MTIARRRAAALIAAAVAAATPCFAQDAVKVGLIVPMTGPFASTGKQLVAGARLYMALNGDTVAGQKIELIVKDDTGNADVTKRLAQELVVNDKVAFLAGFGLTPGALATAPVASEAKIPQMVMMAATAVITERSPYIVRTSFSVPQTTVPLATWAADNGIRKVVSVVSDYGPGIDVETWFKQRFEAAGGQVVEAMRAPLANPDFAPYLQRALDAKPDALLGFVPAGVGPAFMRQFVERGLDKSGIKFIAEGSLTEDDIVNQIGDAALGAITSQHYSAAHDSPENTAFVAAFKNANAGMRPNLMAVQAYDGMHLIYQALNKTNGATDGTALVEAMKGMSWLSPRGPVTVDPDTREMIQNIYIRKVERVNGELYNVEFATIADFKDPSKAKH